MTEIAVPVKIINTSMVAPAIPSNGERMFLSNLDLLWLPVNKVQRLLFYKISPQDEYSSMVEKPKESLSSVLVYFHPLAGRISKGPSGKEEIHCNDEGVEFVEASIRVPFEEAERNDFQRKPFYENLVSIEHPMNSAPLLSVQVTAFEGGGGICVGTTLHHVVADGNSFWHFMKSWSECSRGLPISDPALHDRTFFKGENSNPHPISLTFKEVTNDRITGAKILKHVAADAQPEENIMVSRDKIEKGEESIRKWEDDGREAVYSTFHFTEDMIRKLKELVGAKSSFVAVTSHFWRCVIEARQFSPEQTVGFSLLVDCRGRVKPPLPRIYFGNCICLGIIRTTAQKLQGQDGVCAAELIQELINSCTTEAYINNTIEWLESLESPDKGLIALGIEFAKHPGSYVASSPRFPVYEVDYGWGRPLNVQDADSMNRLGGMVLFGEREGGGIAVSTRFPQHRMERLRGLLFPGGDCVFCTSLLEC